MEILLFAAALLLGFWWWFDKKCVCGHRQGDHVGEYEYEGPEPHPGICWGDHFRCRCVEFKKK